MAGVDGIVSGIDTGSLITQIMAGARRPLETLRSQFDALSAKRSAMQEFNTLLGNLQTAVAGVDSTQEMTAYTLSSNQPDNLGVTASGDPSVGTYNVDVDYTARGDIHRSDGYASPTDTLRKGTLNLTVGGVYTNVPLQTANGTRTPQGLADYINDNVVGARAYVLNTGSGSKPYRLMIEAENTGATPGNITESVQQSGSGKSLSLSQVQSSRDARMTIANTTVYSPSNQPVDLIPGLTLDLKQATSGTAQITVGRDTQATADNVQKVVDAYNELFSFINKQSGSSTGEGGPLAGDSTMRTINRRIQSVLNSAGGTGAISGLNAIGLGSDQTGTLKFDAAAFKGALDANPSDVMATITGASGLFGALTTELDVIADPVTGLLQNRLDSFGERMSQLTDKVETQEARLITYEETIRQQFLAMELTMAKYQATGDFLTQQMAQWNKS